MAIPRTGCCSGSETPPRLRTMETVGTSRCSRPWRTPSQAGRVGSTRSSGTGTEPSAGSPGVRAELRSRAGHDLTERFAAVGRALPRALRTPDCVVDGEVCALDEQGRPSFQAMQQGSGASCSSSSTCSSSRASRCSTDRSRNAASGSRDSSTGVSRLFVLESFDDGHPARGGEAAATGGDPCETCRFAVPTRETLPRLAEDQGAGRAGICHRRLHERRRPPRPLIRRACAGCAAGGRAGLGGQLRHRVQRGRDRAPARQAAAPRAEDLAACGRAKDAARPE